MKQQYRILTWLLFFVSEQHNLLLLNEQYRVRFQTPRGKVCQESM